jgi:ribosomal protein S18 acetylase RimI-like enzyme
MSITQSDHVLDNPAWHALNSHHAHFASGTERAKRYPAEVSTFCALADHSDAALSDLRQMFADDKFIFLFEVNPPEDIRGWTIQRSFKLVQLVCQERAPKPEHNLDIVELSIADVSEILALIELTHPGPFFPRTVEMGRFIGIREQGILVAMAGERIHLTDYCEISGVCTHPEWQGRGYARLLTGILVNGIWDRGETPFLQVIRDNVTAYHLYESMGFSKRREMIANIMIRT